MRTEVLQGVARGAAWRLEGRLRSALMLAPVLLFLLGLFALPLVQLFYTSFLGSGRAYSLEHYVHVFTTGVYLKVLANTFRVAAWVTGLSLLLGYPVAYLLAGMPERRRNLWMILVLLPFWTSFLVRSFAWIILLQHTGAVNKLLVSWGVVEQPLKLMYNFNGVLVGMVHALMPYAILTMVSVMQGIDRSLVQAAATLGASPWQSFWKVYFPLSLPGVAAGGLLVFIMALGFFITPALLGGPKDMMISQVIETQINLMLNWGFGSALAFVLLLVTLVIYVVYDRVVGLETMWGASAGQTQAGSQVRAGTGAAPSLPAAVLLGPFRLLWDALNTLARGVLGLLDRAVAPLVGMLEGRGVGRVLLWTTAMAVIGYLVVPILVVIPSSVTGAAYLEFPPTSFSWQWYRTYFDDPQWVEATLRSLRVGVLTAILATVLGGFASFAIVRHQFPGKTQVNSFILAPMIIPRMVIAIAVYAVYAKLDLVATHTGLVLAHTVLAVPVVVVTVSAVLKGFDERLEQAALTLGASPVRTFRHVTFPILRTGFLTAALFAFIVSFDELILALFITGGLLQTLPRKMWDDIYLKVNPTLSAVSTLLLVGVVIVLLVIEALRRRLEDVATRR